ncbi:MAG: SNF2 helicase-associated domain-containing protein, partial [Acidimicrobiia bacterium]
MATELDVAVLTENRPHWVNGLIRMLDDVEFAIEDTKRFVPRPTKFLVLDDLAAEADRIDAVLTELVGPPRRGGRKSAPAPGEAIASLQLSWLPGRVVAWLGGWNADNGQTYDIADHLAAAGSVLKWSAHDDIKLPDGNSVKAVQAPLDQALGWLVSLANTKDNDTIGVSATWFGLVAATAVRTVTQGRIVPSLRKAQRGAIAEKPPQGHSHYEVTWKPALVPPETMRLLAESCPGAASVFESKRDTRAFADAVLSDLTDTIVATSARSLEVPAPPPSLANRSDMIEAALARLDGEPFTAPTRLGSDLARRLDQWTSSVTQATKHPLVVELNEPDDSGAWHLRVLAQGEKKSLDPVEQVMVTSSNVRSKRIRDHLVRLERLYDVLLRPGSRRRGEVLLSQDEAWTFMTKVGDVLLANGYDVRVPNLSRKKATPSLRLTAEETTDSVVGAQQLANVRWSAVFDGVELSAADIARLAREARPLVQAQGQWIELDKADLAQAAKALAEREEQKNLSGADMLRHALGLEGSPLAGGVSIAGSGWAVDLLRSAQNLPTDLPTSPDGFSGQLRSYQADALAWIGFLDSAGLGGCLALDMGLGKTPTMLAHIAQVRANGPALVIAPPAVVGNWASEARKFVPDVKV